MKEPNQVASFWISRAGLTERGVEKLFSFLLSRNMLFVVALFSDNNYFLPVILRVL